MIFKRQKIWWLEKTIDGRRIRESLSTTSKRDAQKLAEIRIAEILEHPSAVEKKKKNYTFAALYALWEDRVLPFRKSPANSQEKFWLDHFGDRPVVEIRRDEIDIGPLNTILMAMLGMSGLRSFEKSKGVARD